MKRKHKRQLDGVLNTVKTIVYGVVLVCVLLVSVRTLRGGNLDLRVIKNSLTFKSVNKSDTFYVYGDNTVSYSKLLRTKEIIESNFGFNVQIASERIIFDNDLFTNNYLDGHKSIFRYDNDENKVIITENECVNSKGGLISGTSEAFFGNIALIGASSSFNKDQLFKETLIHEIAHIVGIEHCDNQNCLMFHIASHFGKHDMCDDCRKNLMEKLD